MGYWVETDASDKVTSTRRYSDDRHALNGLSQVKGSPPAGATSFTGGLYNKNTKKVTGVPNPKASRRSELKAKDASTWSEQDKTDARELL